jgi:hypothetical protein
VPRPLHSDCLRGRTHGGASGQSVVHHDHRPPADGHGLRFAAVQALAPLQLGVFARGDLLDLVLAQVQARQIVHDPHAAGGNGPHGVFLVAGKAQLADDEHVQRCVEGLRHLVAHGDTAAGQCQHQEVGLVTIVREMVGQDLASVVAVPEGEMDGAHVACSA